MATMKQPVSAPVALAVSGLSTLASGGFAASAVKDNSVNQPVDQLVALAVTPGAVAGNKQAVLYALSSLDNVNWTTVLRWIGTVSLPTASTRGSEAFSMALAYGSIPPYLQFFVQNDSGAAFTAGSLSISEINPTVV